MEGDPNPYAAPSSPADQVVLPVEPIRFVRLQRWVVLQCLVMAFTLAAQFFSIETIIISGPIFALTSLLIVIVAARTKSSAGIWFGILSVLFAVFIFGLINYAQWGPREARRPVIILSWIYAVVVSPLIVFLLRLSKRTERFS